MASGSSGRPGNSGSKGFDFASDDILCSYEDYGNQETANGSFSDPPIGTNPSKDFQKSRISRSSMLPTTNVYSQPEESLNQELLSTVERTVKKYADNLMRFLEGISSRLSQLELYCYNLDKSIGEMRSDLIRDHGEADSKLKSLDKHLQEVHRSVQILKDKQELAETQKELAKLQLAQKESSSAVHDERAVGSAAESKKSDDVSDAPNTQLALALPNQVAPPQPSHSTIHQQSVPPLSQPPSQTLAPQLPPYYNPHIQSQPSYLPPDAHYRAPQLAPQGPPQPSQTQVNQTPPTQQFPQYQQQWPTQPQQPQPQPQSQPPQMRAPSPQSSVYHPQYMAASQPANPPPPEAMPMPYGYGGAGRPPVQQPQPSPPHMKGGFQSQPGDGYTPGGPHPQISSAGTYMVYDNEGVRGPHHPPQPTHYTQGGYPPANPNMPPQSSSGLMIRSPSPQQFVRNHPYNELIDKLVGMGYRGDHVVSVIQRLEENGQPVDFNAVLDRLNGHSSGGSQRSW